MYMPAKKALSLVEATSRALARDRSPLVREFDLSLVLDRLFREKHFDGLPLRIRKERPETADLTRVINGLLDEGVLKESKDLRYDGLFERPGESMTAEEIVCFMDPLCYLSHLSAMQWHGITDRRPKPVQVSSPRGTYWTTRISDMVQREVFRSRQPQTDETAQEPLPFAIDEQDLSGVWGRFAWRVFPARVRSREIERYQDSYWRSDNYTEASGVRVSTIGRTYLDMIRHPSRCGGIRHVLEVFEEHGRRHRNLIVREVNEFGTKLDKSRVGYILEERLGIPSTPTLESWLRTAVQRGGSRKLDAEADYAPTFSERWCLSLNV